MRRFSTLFLCSLASGCLNAPPDELGVWSESVAYGDVRPHLHTLATFEADLYLAVRPGDVHDDLWDLMDQAKRLGVGVRLWLQLPDYGIWLNEHNVAKFATFARHLLDQASEHGRTIDWLILDLEPGFAYARALRTAATGDLRRLFDLLGEHSDPENFAAAVQQLSRLVDELHARGVRVMAVTLPWAVDDLRDGDTDLQDVFDMPLTGSPWDQVAVILYRPVFSDLFGVALSPAYVASYARSLRASFGGRAQVAIGNISTPGVLVPPGYTDPFDIELDVAAAGSAGIQSVSLFSLDGMLLEGGPEPWLRAALRPTPPTPFLDLTTGLVRCAVRWADNLARPATDIPPPH